MGYDLEKYLLPVWSGDTVYYETGAVLGEDGEITLLYKPEKILGVYDYGLQKTYREGVDYVIEGKKLRRVKGGALPFFAYDELYAKDPPKHQILVQDNCPDRQAGWRYFSFGEEDTYTKKQIAVSYTHKGVWTGSIPQGKAQRFQSFHKKLKNQERIDLVFYGDSITTGCNSSGTPMGGNTPPYAEPFPVMIKKRLETRYGLEIGYRNVAVGGWNSQQGLGAFEERVLCENADLMILGFGMNDGGTETEVYRARIEEMLLRFREKNPNGEIVLLSPMLPNVESNWLRNQPLFAETLYRLEEKYPFVGVADMTTMHGDLLATGKRYRDMTGNNVNHPNDFLARVYAQVILQTLLS